TSTGILPITCSGLPASRKVSPAASATAPPPTPRPWNRLSARCRWRKRRGNTRRRRARCDAELVLQQSWSYAGLTRVSIDLQKSLRKKSLRKQRTFTDRLHDAGGQTVFLG